MTFRARKTNRCTRSRGSRAGMQPGYDPPLTVSACRAASPLPGTPVVPRTEPYRAGGAVVRRLWLAVPKLLIALQFRFAAAQG
jgi:hypothetical protein